MSWHEAAAARSTSRSIPGLVWKTNVGDQRSRSRPRISVSSAFSAPPKPLLSVKRKTARGCGILTLQCVEPFLDADPEEEVE